MRLIAMMLFALIVGGCDKYALVEKFSSPELQAEAKNHIAKLRSRDFEAVEAALDESLLGPELRPELVKMADAIPAGEPTSVRLIAANKSIANGTSVDSSTFEYLFGRKSIAITLAVRETAGKRQIIDFRVIPQEVPFEERGTLSLEGKGPTQYAVLTAALAAVIVSIYALVKCVRTKGLKRKWLWILFILVGFGKLSVNWDTGELGLMPLSVQLLSASYGALGFGPLFLSFSIPVGALVFLTRYRTNSEVSIDLNRAASSERA